MVEFNLFFFIFMKCLQHITTFICLFYYYYHLLATIQQLLEYSIQVDCLVVLVYNTTLEVLLFFITSAIFGGANLYTYSLYVQI